MDWCLTNIISCIYWNLLQKNYYFVKSFRTRREVLPWSRFSGDFVEHTYCVYWVIDELLVHQSFCIIIFLFLLFMYWNTIYVICFVDCGGVQRLRHLSKSPPFNLSTQSIYYYVTYGNWLEVWRWVEQCWVC